MSEQEEAELLTERARQRGILRYSLDPQWVGVAAELAERQDLDRLRAFSVQLAECHDELVAEGHCTCDGAWFEEWVAAQPDE